MQILRRALEEPMRSIAANAGEDGAVIIEKVRRARQEKGDTNVGYNVHDRRVRATCSSEGIIDPAKVTRSAVENAASIAGDDADHRGADHRQA